MEALRQSQAVCPFLRKSTPGQLRCFSSVNAPVGVMSRLQNYGRKCPYMGKALATQNATNSCNSMRSVFNTARAYHSKAAFHTYDAKKAEAVDISNWRRSTGEFIVPGVSPCPY